MFFSPNKATSSQVEALSSHAIEYNALEHDINYRVPGILNEVCKI